MEVRQERVDYQKLMARYNEQVRRATLGDDPTALGRCGLQCAYGGRADGNDPPSFRLRKVDRLRGFGTDAEPFRMDRMIFHTLCLHRLKGIQADVQSKMNLPDTCHLGLKIYPPDTLMMTRWSNCPGEVRPLPAVNRLLFQVMLSCP